MFLISEELLGVFSCLDAKAQRLSCGMKILIRSYLQSNFKVYLTPYRRMATLNMNTLSEQGEKSFISKLAI